MKVLVNDVHNYSKTVVRMLKRLTPYLFQCWEAVILCGRGGGISVQSIQDFGTMVEVYLQENSGNF